jgi:hypothetical protein
MALLKDMADYNPRECFMAIDEMDRQLINSVSLDKYLNRCDIYISDEEFDSFFALVDTD